MDRKPGRPGAVGHSESSCLSVACKTNGSRPSIWGPLVSTIHLSPYAGVCPDCLLAPCPPVRVVAPRVGVRFSRSVGRRFCPPSRRPAQSLRRLPTQPCFLRITLPVLLVPAAHRALASLRFGR